MSAVQDLQSWKVSQEALNVTQDRKYNDLEVSHTALQGRVTGLERENFALRRENEGLEARNINLVGELDEARAQIGRDAERIDEVARERDELRGRNQELDDPLIRGAARVIRPVVGVARAVRGFWAGRADVQERPYQRDGVSRRDDSLPPWTTWEDLASGAGGGAAM